MSWMTMNYWHHLGNPIFSNPFFTKWGTHLRAILKSPSHVAMLGLDQHLPPPSLTGAEVKPKWNTSKAYNSVVCELRVLVIRVAPFKLNEGMSKCYMYAHITRDLRSLIWKTCRLIKFVPHLFPNCD